MRVVAYRTWPQSFFQPHKTTPRGCFAHLARCSTARAARRCLCACMTVWASRAGFQSESIQKLQREGGDCSTTVMQLVMLVCNEWSHVIKNSGRCTVLKKKCPYMVQVLSAQPGGMSPNVTSAVKSFAGTSTGTGAHKQRVTLTLQANCRGCARDSYSFTYTHTHTHKHTHTYTHARQNKCLRRPVRGRTPSLIALQHYQVPVIDTTQQCV